MDRREVLKSVFAAVAGAALPLGSKSAVDVDFSFEGQSITAILTENGITKQYLLGTWKIIQRRKPHYRDDGYVVLFDTKFEWDTETKNLLIERLGRR